MTYFRPIIIKAAGQHPSPYLLPATPIIKLNSNENPYPPSPQALNILRLLDGEWLRRYPDPYSQAFCQAAATALGVPADWIIVSNGCDALLNILMQACVDSTRSVVYPTPTYGLYQTLANIYGAHTVEITYNSDYSLPLDQIAAAQGALTLIASPNSPSGKQVPLAELQQLAETVQGVLVIDEAYVDFAEDSALSLVNAYERVIVLRTLSKGYGLAGLRFGFGIAQPPLLSGLFKVKDSYGVDAIANRIATAAIADQAYKNDRVAQIKADRQQLTSDLQRLGLDVAPSQGNFVLATHTNAERLHDDLRKHDIWVRHFDHPQLNDKLRITVGTPSQNAQLLKTLSRLIKEQ
ncbi:MAG: histidinol-phosphate transaminase [Leptolyngbyaceae cyanobacterium MAG.088]|nr:histidinol-phosphate transaminase [Leptolyngbyaceae cyanobacterium MAG.088]